jgi:hypothetical protein
MITLSWGNLKNNDFMVSLAKLFAAPMDFKDAQKCVLLGRAVKEQQELADAAHKKLLEKYGKPDKEQEGFFTIPEAKRKAYGEEMEKFSKHKFKVKVGRLDAEAISDKLEFSPQDLLLLEDVLAPIELEEPTEELAPDLADIPKIGKAKKGKKAQSKNATH